VNFIKNKANLVGLMLFGLVLGLAYYRWFTPTPIIGGDWPYFFNETIKEFPFSVPSWNTWRANGLGGTNQIYFLQIFENFTTSFVNWFNIPWVLVYKILWFGLFLVLGVFSSMYLLKIILQSRPLWVRLIAPIIFVSNTYALMVADGGQMGVLLSYSLSPLVLATFIKLINTQGDRVKKLEQGLVCGLILSAQVMFDPRIAYLTMIASFIYFVFNFLSNKNSFSKFLYSIVFTFIIPGIITILIHAVWILPYILSKQSFANNFGEAYSGVGIVKFLSFASFSQTLSLLHPNWPENIFGKVYFMKPEFLIIPIVAFSSLFFLQKIKDSNNKIIYFCILGLLGAFLAKGSNPPYGEIYLSAFSNIPGFILFRDSTKFYVFVTLAYSVLIPFGLEKLSTKFSKVKLIVPILFIFFWLFTINPAILGQLSGTFRNHEVPQEYLLLKDFLNGQPDFSRTFWVPRQNRFTFYSDMHPSVEAVSLFKASSNEEIINKLKKEDARKYLEKLAIKYVIIPYDPMADIFQKDRKYDDSSYKNLINDLNKVKWLKKINGFEKIAVFQTPEKNDHIYLMNGKVISNKMITPYHYQVTVNMEKSTELIFSESYNPYWIIKEDRNISYSKKTLDNLNSFKLNKIGTYSFEIYFSQENYYTFGRIISISTLFMILLFFVLLKKEILLHN